MGRPKVTLQLEVPRPAVQLGAVDFEIQTLFDQSMSASTNYDVSSPAWVGREKITIFIKASADQVVNVWISPDKTNFYLWRSLTPSTDMEASGSDYYYAADLPMCCDLRITVGGTVTVLCQIQAR